MELEEVLRVLHSWLGLEVEVSTHGSNGALPVSALEVKGILRRGEELASPSASPGSLVFVLDGADGKEVGSFRLYPQAFSGGGWFDDEEEVLEIRSGVIKILLATVLN